MKFFEGYITQDLDSGDVFCGTGIFCRFFALKGFLSYRPLKQVWADLPTAVRFRVNRIKTFNVNIKSEAQQKKLKTVRGSYTDLDLSIRVKKGP